MRPQIDVSATAQTHPSADEKTVGGEIRQVVKNYGLQVAVDVTEELPTRLRKMNEREMKKESDDLKSSNKTLEKQNT